MSRSRLPIEALVVAGFFTLATVCPSPSYAEPGTGLRLTYESLGGLGMLAGSVGTGYLITRGGPSSGSRDGVMGGAFPMLLFLFVAPIFLTPLGVYEAGHASGANGSYWGSLGGFCAGGLVMLVPAALLVKKNHQVLATITWVAGMIGGAVIGYEIWNHGPGHQPNPTALTPSNVRPGLLLLNLARTF